MIRRHPSPTRHGQFQAFGTAVRVAALVAPLLMAGCALNPDRPAGQSDALTRSQTNQAFDTLLRRQDRVYRVITPLLVNNTPLCKSSARPLLGFTAKNRYSYPAELRAAAESTLKLGDTLQVLQVLEGGGAMRAGLRRGDLLQAIEGEPLPQGPQAETEAAKRVLPLMRSARELELTLSRDGTPMTVKVALTPACALTVEVGNAPHVNAYTDGRRILVTAGMLDVLSDEELAVILAREVAHGTLRHANTLKMVSTLAGVIDALLPLRPELSAFAGSAGIRPMDPLLDQEADRIAMYMLARAGFDPALAPRTLEKLARAYPATITNAYPSIHPWTAERAALMETTLTEIRRKQRTRKPLLP